MTEASCYVMISWAKAAVIGAVGGLVTFVALLLLVAAVERVQIWRKKRKVTK